MGKVKTVMWVNKSNVFHCGEYLGYEYPKTALCGKSVQGFDGCTISKPIERNFCVTCENKLKIMDFPDNPSISRFNISGRDYLTVHDAEYGVPFPYVIQHERNFIALDRQGIKDLIEQLVKLL